MQDQPFQILVLLLENPGELVTREQLRERLWPADTFVDFDHSLNSAVKKLRQALNDDPDVPRFVETLPRRGYRFIAPMRNGASPPLADIAPRTPDDHASAPADQLAPVPPTPLPSKLQHLKLWAAGALGFVIALGLTTWVRMPRAPSAVSSVPIRLVPVTTYSGAVSKGSFSPDGNQIAFAWEGEQKDNGKAGGIDIYVKQIGSEKSIPLTHDFAYNFFPAWSPDGRYIAFLHGGPNERPGLFMIPALGGPPRKLYEFAFIQNCRPSLSWSPDGKFLIFSDALPDHPCNAKQLNVETRAIRDLTSAPVPSTGDWDAQYSPDGQSIAFIRNTKDVEDIYVMPAAGGSPRRVTFDNRLLSGLAWTPDSKEIVFSSNRGGAVWGLWRLTVTGGAPERVSVGSDRAYMPAISLKGNRLIYASGFWNENIWRVPVDRAHHIGKAEKLIFSNMQEEGPQYSPDGKRIAFQSTRSGNFEIWRADADGGNLVQLTSFAGPLTGTPHWSPDGRQISFDTRPGPHPNVHIIGSDGGPPRRFINNSADEGVASWSHDGRWLYFASNRNGAWQVWKRTVDGGQPVQVTANGGFAALESPNGKILYYTKFDQPGIFQVPVTGGEETKVVDEPPANYWGYFALGNDGLYFLGEVGTPGKTRPGFKFFDFATHKTIVMGEMEKDPYEGAPGMSLSPDRRFILYVRLDEARNNLMLAENFR